MGYALLVSGLVLAAASIAVIAIFAAHGGGKGSTDRAESAVGSVTARPVAVTPTTVKAPVSRRSLPGTTQVRQPATTVPVAKQATGLHGATAKLPLHGAVYRGGKLYLAGALPTRQVADAFVKKASEVIGSANVVEHYTIDRRAPVPTDGRVRVDEPFLFRTGSAQIDPKYSSLLNLGVTVMRLNPKVTMRVVGYTDDAGPLPVNLALSQARAKAVADWITQRGISAQRFVLIGKGPADPLVSNATPEGRTRNRRIEVELLGLLKG